MEPGAVPQLLQPLPVALAETWALAWAWAWALAGVLVQAVEGFAGDVA